MNKTYKCKRKYHNKLIVIALDFKKAYDSIDRENVSIYHFKPNNNTFPADYTGRQDKLTSNFQPNNKLFPSDNTGREDKLTYKLKPNDKMFPVQSWEDTQLKINSEKKVTSFLHC